MFDIEQLIEEVSERPAIWDCNSPEYQIRKERMRAWDKICHVLFDDFENFDVSKKNESCRSLQRRWKSLRDCYVRELHQSKQNKGRYYRRKYVFFNALSFLGTTIRAKSKSKVKEDVDPLCDDTMEEEETTSAEVKQESFRRESTATPSDTNYSIKRLKLDELRNRSTPQSRTSQDQQFPMEEEDDDRLFLLSLLTDLKKVPEDNKLEAKSELLLVLNKWRRTAVEAWDMEEISND